MKNIDDLSTSLCLEHLYHFIAPKPLKNDDPLPVEDGDKCIITIFDIPECFTPCSRCGFYLEAKKGRIVCTACHFIECELPD